MCHAWGQWPSGRRRPTPEDVALGLAFLDLEDPQYRADDRNALLCWLVSRDVCPDQAMEDFRLLARPAPAETSADGTEAAGVERRMAARSRRSRT